MQHNVVDYQITKTACVQTFKPEEASTSVFSLEASESKQCQADSQKCYAIDELPSLRIMQPLELACSHHNGYADHIVVQHMLKMWMHVPVR